MSDNQNMYNTLLSKHQFCHYQPDPYRSLGMSAAEKAGFIIFFILNFIVFAMMTFASLSKPSSKSKFKTCLSCCDIRPHWKWKKEVQNGEDIFIFKAKEPKSLSGSIITVYLVLILFGILFYVTKYMVSNRQVSET